MVQVVPLKDIREQLSELINQVAYGRSQVVVTKFGKPKAVIVGYEDYERIMNPRSRFTQEEWDKAFSVFERARKRTKGIGYKKLEKAVKTAVSEVRKEKSGQSSR